MCSRGALSVRIAHLCCCSGSSTMHDGWGSGTARAARRVWAHARPRQPRCLQAPPVIMPCHALPPYCPLRSASLCPYPVCVSCRVRAADTTRASHRVPLRCVPRRKRGAWVCWVASAKGPPRAVHACRAGHVAVIKSFANSLLGCMQAAAAPLQLPQLPLLPAPARSCPQRPGRRRSTTGPRGCCC